MTVLFPPVLDAVGPAFEFKGGASAVGGEEFAIHFVLPTMVPEKDIKHIQVSIKYANTGDPAVNTDRSPDGQVLYISAKSRYFVKENAFGNYTVKFPYSCFKNGFPARNTPYLVQIRFGLNDLWTAGDGIEAELDRSKFAQWRQQSMLEVPSLFGEWSNISKYFCYERAVTNISYSYADFMPKVIWEYDSSNDDALEQVLITYSYMGMNEITIRKSEVFSGDFTQNNKQKVEWVLPIAPVTRIRVIVEAVTKNNARYHGDNEYCEIPAISERRATYLHGKVEDLEMPAAELEDGAIGKTITMPDSEKGNFYNVYRINTLTLDCIKIIENQEILPGEVISFKDYTVEMGEDYQYVVSRPLTRETQDDPDILIFNDIYPFGPENPAYGRIMKMECSYLVSRGHQLRLQGNVTLSNFKRNTQDSFQTTIGSKYPFYTRPSEMNYRTFTINALISINFDPTSTFMFLDAFGELKIGDKIESSKYFLLMDSSPGCKPYFIQLNEKGADGYPLFQFVGLPPAERKALEDADKDWEIVDYDKRITALVNRCCRSLVLNGLWWKDDKGNQQLWIQDRDILTEIEFSLSRARRGANDHDIYDRLPRPPSSFILQTNATSVYDKSLHRHGGLISGTTPTDEMVYVERKYREKVMEWLSNGEPKLFRSETEGNMIVMLSGVSFTPYDKSYRMIYSMSATVTEIADFTGENLFEYNLIPTYIKSAYINQSDYSFVPGHYDPAIVTALYYQYRKEFDIPSMLLRPTADSEPLETFSVNTYPAVFNGVPPYTFTYGDFPRGFEVTASGELKGSPIGTSLIEPGIGWIKVTDSQGQSDTIYIPYGHMYLRLTGPETVQLRTESVHMLDGEEVMIVGDKIKEIELSPMMRGGVRPFTYYGNNLPAGVVVDETTGEVSGFYRNEITNSESADAFIEVKDEVGQSWTIKVGFLEGKYALTFVHLPEFDFDYTEVNEDIPWKYLPKGASGGEPFTDKDEPYYKYTGVNLPLGFFISDGNATWKGERVPNGVIYGAPTEDTEKAGVFSVICQDAVGTTQQIDIYFNRILKEFKFVWTEDYNILKDVDRIPLGTDVEKDYLPAVSGGLPFTTGSPYRFRAVDLLPFRISKGGLVAGKATIAMPRHQAYIYAKDARGKEIPILGNPENLGQFDGGITVSEISSAVWFDGKYYEVVNLKQEEPLTEGSAKNVILFDKENASHNMNRIPAGRIHGGTPPYTVNLYNAPDGITLAKGHYAIADEDYWYFTGQIPGPTTERRGWLQITDANGENCTVQVIFREGIGTFVWNPFNNVINADPGAYVRLPLAGISGGVPSYSIYLDSTNEEWVLKTFSISPPANKNSLNGWALVGTLPSQAIERTIIYLVCKDNRGMTVRGQAIISKKDGPVIVRLDGNPLAGKTLLVGIDNIPQTQIMHATGGSGSFTYGYDDIELPGGIKMTTDGKIGGTPVAENLEIKNVAQKLYAIDAAKGEKERPSLGEIFTVAKVINPPQIAKEIGGTPTMTTATYQVEGLLLNQSFTSKPLFTGLAAIPRTMCTVKITKGTLPDGMDLYYPGDTAFISGMTQTLSGATDIEVTMTITPEYAPQFTKVVTVKFSGTTGRFSVVQNMTFSKIPAGGVGKDLTPVPIGEASGGKGPFTWTPKTALPDGMKVEISTDTRKANIVGKYPAKETPPSTLQFEVVDTANGEKQTVSVPFGGAFPALEVTGEITVPAGKVGTAITEIKAFDKVKGGTQPYLLLDDKAALSSRGFIYDPDTGIISGAPSNPAPEETGSIFVQDANKQKVEIKVKFGKIDGELTFIESRAEGPVKLGASKVNVAIANDKLVKLKGGAVGGTPDYAYAVSEDATYGPKAMGWEVTLGKDGNFTAMKPTKKQAAGYFIVNLTDSKKATFKVSVAFEKVE